jgi:two-component system, NtrC family, response regulator
MKSKLLTVDDAPEIREIVSEILEIQGFEVIEAGSAAELKSRLEGEQQDVVLLDLKLPDGDGLDLLPLIKQKWPDTEVIVLTGNASIDAAVAATKHGAYQFIQKPFDPKTLVLQVEKALEHKSLATEAASLRTALSSMSGGSAPIFQSAGMKAVVRTIERIAPADVSVLITGESGTGKEVITDLIHGLSPRAKGPCIKINCAALPRELIESELFGHVKGSFTGAHADKAGLFEQSEGGTLMLDELSEMPIDTQSKLLRVLQEREARRIGGKNNYKIDCRVIAATNRRPEEAMKDGKLREDLFYRISAITVHLPPLRERRDDILPLARAFLHRFASQAGRTINGFDPKAEDLLQKFDWPGNVRQLQNEIQRATLMCEGTKVEAADLSITAAVSCPDDESLTLMEAMERNTIVQMLKETGGNKLETAKRLGIGRQTLYNKIKAYGIET